MTMIGTNVTKEKSLRSTNAYSLALPPADLQLQQDEEWCVAEVEGKWERIRFHDYARLFAVPGLYEYLMYDTLKCDSPAMIRELLQKEMDEIKADPENLRVLDLGAGNGMVGEEMQELGAEKIVGVDIIETAAEATDRDRPGIYSDYHVVDLTSLSDEESESLAGHRCNCLTCVAALGFGDIPTRAFSSAYNLIDTGGWFAFNIKEDFLKNDDRSGFARLINKMIKEGTMEIRQKQRYRHRFSTNRQPLFYYAIVGQKMADIDESTLED